MHEKNAFLTLTYSNDKLKSPKLVYEDFQLFMKRLRKLQDERIGFFCTGEYGDKEKRPHWHAIVFNWQPSDATYKYTTDRGDKVYESETLTKTWGHGIAEFGSVTFESAGYCARYAAKKLVHGKDGEHEFEPISKKSNKQAIGKTWLEKNWPDIFNHGICTVRKGKEIIESSIPRYYEKWLKEHHPSEWLRYVTEVKFGKMKSAEEKALRLRIEYLELAREQESHMITPNERVRKFNEQKFKLLQQHLKL